MRLTTNVPKSEGRVIIWTGVEMERIDVALGLIRRNVSRNNQVRSRYQINILLCEIEEGMRLGNRSLV